MLRLAQLFIFISSYFLIDSNLYAIEVLGCLRTKDLTYGVNREDSDKQVLVPNQTVLQILEREGEEKETNRWVRVFYDNKNLWMQTVEVDLIPLKSCLALEEKGKSTLTPKKRFDYMVSAGLYTGQSSDSFSSIVNSVSDGDNVGGFLDPLITKVDKGTGYSLSVCNRLTIGSGLVNGCLGYMEESFKLTKYSNPYIQSDNKKLSDLSSSTQNLVFKSFIYHFGASLPFFIKKKSNLGFGVGLRGNYYFNAALDYELLTGTVWKGTQVKMKTGPSGLVNRPHLNFYYEQNLNPKGTLQKFLINTEITLASELGLQLIFGF